MYIIRCQTPREPGKYYYLEDLWEDQTALFNTSIYQAKKFDTEQKAINMGLKLFEQEKVTVYIVEELEKELKQEEHSMTAYEAFKATNDRVEGLAKEFIWNEANPAINKAIDSGFYDTELQTEFYLYEPVGKKVVEMLRKDGYNVELNNRTLTIQWAVEDNGDLYPVEDPVVENPKKVVPEKTEPEYTFWSEDKDVFVGVANTSGDLKRFLDDLPNMPFDNGASVTVAATKGETVRLTIFGASDIVKPLEPRTRYTAGSVGELACILAKMPPELKFEGGAQVVASYDSFIQKAQVTVRK